MKLPRTPNIDVSGKTIFPDYSVVALELLMPMTGRRTEAKIFVTTPRADGEKKTKKTKKING